MLRAKKRKGKKSFSGGVGYVCSVALKLLHSQKDRQVSRDSEM